MADRTLPSFSLSLPGTRRAVVVGAGSFGTAVAVLLVRAGLRTTLQARTAEQADRLRADRENRVYLPGVELPRELRDRVAWRPGWRAPTSSSSACRPAGSTP